MCSPENLPEEINDREGVAREGQGYPCWSHDKMIYIYIYIYVCVCVCNLINKMYFLSEVGNRKSVFKLQLFRDNEKRGILSWFRRLSAPRTFPLSVSQYVYTCNGKPLFSSFSKHFFDWSMLLRAHHTFFSVNGLLFSVTKNLETDICSSLEYVDLLQFRTIENIFAKSKCILIWTNNK